MKLISILIPCNNKSFLRETLKSVLACSYSRIEVILVCDGIRISNRDLPQEFRNGISHKILVSPGDGIVDALNFGLQNCSGEYIARLDSDDIMTKDRIRKQVKLLDSDANLAAVGGHMDILDETGKLLRVAKFPTTVSKARQASMLYSPLPHPGTTFRRDSVNQVGGYRKSFELVEDWDLWLRLLEIGDIVNLNETVVLYRQHENQSTNIRKSIQEQRITKLLLIRSLEARRIDVSRLLEVSDEIAISEAARLLKFQKKRAYFVLRLDSLRLVLSLMQKSKGKTFIKLAVRLVWETLFLFLFFPYLSSLFAVNRKMRLKRHDNDQS
jgi:glycosyltransferase involved in cell wall biosynthesis